MFVYKIVTEDIRGNFHSYCSPADILYSPGVKAVPREGDGPLAVFTSIKWARKFLSIRNKLDRIFYVEYEPSTHCHLWFLSNNGHLYPLHCAPDGTAYADSVTLIKEIDCDWL